MPTKTTKKDKGEKNKGEKPKGEKGKDNGQQLPVVIAPRVAMGPPYWGAGPLPGGSWSMYPPMDGRVTPCPGFWGYVKRYPSVGGIVAQLGAEAATGAAQCVLYTYYQYVFKPPIPGDSTFVLTLNLGPVTRRPRYGSVQIAGLIQIMGPGGHWVDFRDDLPSNTSLNLYIRPRLQAGGVYTLRFGVAPIVTNAGQQSYGEAIVNSAVLTAFLPFDTQTPQAALAKKATAEADALLSLLLNQDEQQAEEISLNTGVGMGVGYM